MWYLNVREKAKQGEKSIPLQWTMFLENYISTGKLNVILYIHLYPVNIQDSSSPSISIACTEVAIR
jgi:hypothetical protein